MNLIFSLIVFFVLTVQQNVKPQEVARQDIINRTPRVFQTRLGTRIRATGQSSRKHLIPATKKRRVQSIKAARTVSRIIRDPFNSSKSVVVSRKIIRDPKRFVVPVRRAPQFSRSQLLPAFVQRTRPRISTSRRDPIIVSSGDNHFTRRSQIRPFIQLINGSFMRQTTNQPSIKILNSRRPQTQIIDRNAQPLFSGQNFPQSLSTARFKNANIQQPITIRPISIVTTNLTSNVFQNIARQAGPFTPDVTRSNDGSRFINTNIRQPITIKPISIVTMNPTSNVFQNIGRQAGPFASDVTRSNDGSRFINTNIRQPITLRPISIVTTNPTSNVFQNIGRQAGPFAPDVTRSNDGSTGFLFAKENEALPSPVTIPVETEKTTNEIRKTDIDFSTPSHTDLQKSILDSNVVESGPVPPSVQPSRTLNPSFDHPPGFIPPNDAVINELNSADDFLAIAKEMNLKMRFTGFQK